MRLADLLTEPHARTHPPATPATSATPAPNVANVASVARGIPADAPPWSTLPATPDYERRVRHWLAEIGETDPECIEQVVANALADPLSLAACVPPPDPIAEAVALVRAGHRVELYGATLGTRFTLVPDEAAAAVERAAGRVPYTLSEVAALFGWDADDLRLGHEVKARFAATALGGGNG
jgi:hypothetical protein